MYRTNFDTEIDALETDEFSTMGEWEVTPDLAAENPFNEVEEMELAAELMGVTNEAELDQFLGKLFKKAWRGIRKIGGAVLRPLGGALKGLAKKALPFVGGALGSFIPIPGVGTAIGTALGGALSNALEMEFEGMNDEDREFEMARRFVRIAGSAAQQAAQAPANADPQAIVRSILTTAAQQHVPGMSMAGAAGGKRRSGRWVRRGRTIMLLGV